MTVLRHSPCRRGGFCAAIACILLAPALPPAAAAQERGGRVLPEWLSVSGEARLRHESLGNQYRAGLPGSDQSANWRLLLLAEADAGPMVFTVELQDARGWLKDSGSPVTASWVNTLDVLQAHVRVPLRDVVGLSEADLRIGRQTVEVGSARIVERTDFTNVIASFTGVSLFGQTGTGDEIAAFAVAPVGRRPSGAAELLDNTASSDEEEWGRTFAGLHWRERDAFGVEGLWAEAFVYGLHERDRDGVATFDRRHLEPGLRLLREPRTGRTDLDLDVSVRVGTRRASTAAADTRDLDVRAGRVHASLGHTFDAPWRPRLRVSWDWASGDGDISDGSLDRYENLFGGRRSDLGHTGIYGPFTQANLSLPQVRLEARPGQATDWRISWAWASLADARDGWINGRLRDPTGASGRFIGHALDARVRHRVAGAVLEVGGAVLLRGRFAETAPGPARNGDALYGYVQVTRSF